LAVYLSASTATLPAPMARAKTRDFWSVLAITAILQSPARPL
jgi:hypothetical protein